jgi:4-hydroxybenzoate polyprenyltransferase
MDQSRGTDNLINRKIPLVVDLDNSLLRVDVLAEWSIRLAIQRPLRFVFGLATQRSSLPLKRFVASHFSVSSDLPHNMNVLKLIETAQQSGHDVFIATASLPSIVIPIGERIEGIREVFSSEEKNLKGVEKARLLVQRFGTEGFDYVGDSKSDLVIWNQSRHAFFAGARREFQKIQRESTKQIFDLSEEPGKRVLIRALRLDHWVKNILVAIPLILAGSYQFSAIQQVLALALAFSFTASSLYLVNDILDVDSDRLHSSKKKRPIAAGELSALRAIWLSTGLLLSGLIGGIIAGGLTGVLLTLTYGILSLTYTLFLKRIPLVDIVALASLYTFRIIAGAIIVSTYISYWLMLFSFVTFAALATLKRVTEISSLASSISGAPSSLDHRGYNRGDELLVTALGAAFSVASITVLGIYMQDEFGSTTHEIMSLILVTCWSIWMLTMWFDQSRGRMHHDPIRHALTTPRSWILVGIMLAIYFWIGLER